MSIGVEVTAVDVQWQILMLQEFPKIANKHFYPAMKRATTSLAGVIEPNLPFKDLSGRARSEFRKAVSGNGLNITGRVGWPGGAEAWWVNVLEYGATQHEQGYIPRIGVTIKLHPGIKAMKFMARGYLQAKSETDPEMARAAEAVVNEMAKK